jgi:hypothetical protein
LPLGFCADAILVYFPSFKPLSYILGYLAWQMRLANWQLAQTKSNVLGNPTKVS